MNNGSSGCRLTDEQSLALDELLMAAA